MCGRAVGPIASRPTYTSDLWMELLARRGPVDQIKLYAGMFDLLDVTLVRKYNIQNIVLSLSVVFANAKLDGPVGDINKQRFRNLIYKNKVKMSGGSCT